MSFALKKKRIIEYEYRFMAIVPQVRTSCCVGTYFNRKYLILSYLIMKNYPDNMGDYKRLLGGLLIQIINYNTRLANKTAILYNKSSQVV